MAYRKKPKSVFDLSRIEELRAHLRAVPVPVAEERPTGADDVLKLLWPDVEEMLRSGLSPAAIVTSLRTGGVDASEYALILAIRARRALQKKRRKGSRKKAVNKAANVGRRVRRSRGDLAVDVRGDQNASSGSDDLRQSPGDVVAEDRLPEAVVLRESNAAPQDESRVGGVRASDGASISEPVVQASQGVDIEVDFVSSEVQSSVAGQGVTGESAGLSGSETPAVPRRRGPGEYRKSPFQRGEKGI
ncbi:MAG: hypothetical protein IAI50_02545 [Candidatus Eremiobacteraeota bacterium]|nr:hypothetical protein [Candidatus Eremiobacteraeota bacterium]